MLMFGGWIVEEFSLQISMRFFKRRVSWPFFIFTLVNLMEHPYDFP